VGRKARAVGSKTGSIWGSQDGVPKKKKKTASSSARVTCGGKENQGSLGLKTGNNGEPGREKIVAKREKNKLQRPSGGSEKWGP